MNQYVRPIFYTCYLEIKNKKKTDKRAVVRVKRRLL